MKITFLIITKQSLLVSVKPDIDQQRKQAVHFYLTHGKNISYTVRTLGYPCRSLLSDWICEDVKEHYPSILKS